MESGCQDLGNLFTKAQARGQDEDRDVPIESVNEELYLSVNMQGWRNGESTCLPPMLPGFDSRSLRHMWVEFVVGSLLAPRGSSPGNSGFPLSSKTNTAKFLFDPDCTNTC